MKTQKTIVSEEKRVEEIEKLRENRKTKSKIKRENQKVRVKLTDQMQSQKNTFWMVFFFNRPQKNKIENRFINFFFRLQPKSIKSKYIENRFINFFFDSKKETFFFSNRFFFN